MEFTVLPGRLERQGFPFAAFIAIIALMGTTRARAREIDVTALMDMEVMTPLMYTADMAKDSDQDEEGVPINEARNQLGGIIEQARYFDHVTYLLNRRKRVAVIAPTELGEIAEAVGGPAAAVEILKAHIESKKA